jgi:ferredoxin
LTSPQRIAAPSALNTDARRANPQAPETCALGAEELPMADRKNKWPDNVPGSWYVDKECILCSVCADAAPRNFRMSKDEDHDVVYKQPESADEIAQCNEAMDNCPVEAIGNDGP